MTNRIPLAAVLGWPIAHSKSPIIHGHWLTSMGIAGHYIPIGLPPEDFARGVRSLELLGFRGANVTIPHKEAALALADEVTPRARAIGAANTLVFQDGRILADNTDGIGFMANLAALAPHWRADAAPALILGAGGAARAIISALLDAGCPEIHLTNRTRNRAEELAAHFGPSLQVIDWENRNDAIAGVGMIANTTSLGMTGQAPLAISLTAAHPNTLVTDIVYTPLQTDLLAQATSLNLPTVDGVGMLLHQAVPGFEAWFGVRPTVDETLRAKVLTA